MPFDAAQQKAWLDSLGLEGTDRAAVEGLLKNPKNVEKIGATVMARSDYSKAQDEVARKQKELDAENLKVQNFYRETTEFKARGEATIRAAEEKAAKLAADIAKIQTKMGTIKTQYAIDDADIAEIMTIPAAAAAPPVEQKRDPETGKFVTREEAQNLPFIPAALMNISQQHNQLFPGTTFDAEQLTADAIKNKRTLAQEWEAKFDVPKKRTEIAEAAIQARIQKEVQEQVTAYKSENANPAAAPSGIVAPVLSMQIDRPNFDKPKDPNRGVSAAVASFGTHGAAKTA
jgi:hypothetical protein